MGSDDRGKRGPALPTEALSPMLERKKWEKSRDALRRDIEAAINRHSGEAQSNTPDFLLAEYLMRCFDAFTTLSRSRERWYGHELAIGGPRALTADEVLPPPPENPPV